MPEKEGQSNSLRRSKQNAMNYLVKNVTYVGFRGVKKEKLPSIERTSQNTQKVHYGHTPILKQLILMIGQLSVSCAIEVFIGFMIAIYAIVRLYRLKYPDYPFSVDITKDQSTIDDQPVSQDHPESGPHEPRRENK